MLPARLKDDAFACALAHGASPFIGEAELGTLAFMARTPILKACLVFFPARV
jgi:hypothetical protein